jgi:hypothetical protein
MYTAPAALQVRSLTPKGFRRAGLQFTENLRLLLVVPDDVEPKPGSNQITAAMAQAIEETPGMLVTLRLTREQAIAVLEAEPQPEQSTEERHAALQERYATLEERLMRLELTPGAAAAAGKTAELQRDRDEAIARADASEARAAADRAEFTRKLAALEARIGSAAIAAAPGPTPAGDDAPPAKPAKPAPAAK